MAFDRCLIKDYLLTYLLTYLQVVTVPATSNCIEWDQPL